MDPTNRTSFACAGILALFVPGLAQEVKRPTLQVPPVADGPAQFVSPGWRLETDRVREADLNNDGRPDAAQNISERDFDVIERLVAIGSRPLAELNEDRT